MNILKYFFCLSISIFPFSLLAQSSDPVLVRINNDMEIKKSEFEYVYKKDALYSKSGEKSIDKFIESYINLKLSVEEAKQQGLDKQEDFDREYSIYLEQSEKLYLTDSISPEALSKKMHDRLKENIEVSHIFLPFNSKDMLPKDTVKLYNEAVSIRESVNGKAESFFEDLAAKYAGKNKSTNSIPVGYVGWKTAFSTRYPFEETMYNLPSGQVSQPVRTTEGYHLIKVLDRRPDPGQINIAQIVLVYPRLNPSPHEKDSVYKLAMDIHDKILAGEDFGALCYKYSADEQTYAKGGKLGWFGVNRAIPRDLEKLLFGMENPGEITAPVETGYGYYIFKLIAKTPLLPWEMMKESLIDAIEKSDRNEILTAQKIERLAAEYPYSIEKSIYAKLEEAANSYSFSDSTYFTTIYPVSDMTVLKVRDHNYSVKDFVHYLDRNPSTDYTLSTDMLKYKFNDFILDRLVEEKRIDLPNRYPDFRYLTQEFHDGILFFNIMNENVWEKAQTDRSALEKLFKMDIDKYKWDSPRYKGLVIHATDKNTIEKVKAIIKKHKKDEDLQAILNKAFNNESGRNIIIEKGLWAQGDNPYIDRLIYKMDTPNEIVGFPEVMAEGAIIEKPETADDVIGLLTEDYQAILEKQWYNALHKKYKVEIDNEVLDKIKAEYR